MSTQLQTQAKEGSKSSAALTANNAVKHHFSSQRGFSAEAQRYPIHAKLKIGQPGDKYELEADRVAEQVMRMAEPSRCSFVAGSSLSNGTISEQYSEVTPELTSRINTARNGGKPLSRSVRAFFEPRFEQDFSQVHVHSDVESDTLNKELKASAFTTGKEIFFRQGEYDPGSFDGKRLLAHELTHVVQQHHSTNNNLQLLIDPATAISTGAAIFGVTTATVTMIRGGNNLIWSRNIANAIHSWPSGRTPSPDHWIHDRSRYLIGVDLNGPPALGYFAGVNARWNLMWDHNGADISQARVSIMNSSDWAHSGINITFELQNATSYENNPRGRAAMICYIGGTLNSFGRGDMDFHARILLFADGSARVLQEPIVTRGDERNDFQFFQSGAGWNIVFRESPAAESEAIRVHGEQAFGDLIEPNPW